MLEIEKIIKDIDNLGREQAEFRNGLQDELSTADQVMRVISDDLDTARARIEGARTSWLTAGFDVSPETVYPLPDLPAAHAVVASDGSQIMPDKNEAALCFLLNTSAITIYYGIPERPIAETYPHLYYREDEIWESDYGGQKIRLTEKMISARRSVSEMNALERGIETASIQSEPDAYRDRILGEYFRAFDLARSLGIPIAGYISDPGGKDFVNSMRIMLCDQASVDCDKCLHKKDDSEFPCEQVGKLKDSSVFHKRLAEGERSIMMSGTSRILQQYGDHEIRMCYLNTGKEIVRIEVPRWVAEDTQMMNLVHAVCCDQSRKGRGYPITLSEAHEQAVIRSSERAAFYEMVERAFIKYGARISRSEKRIAKNY
jgi:hypothetical protein